MKVTIYDNTKACDILATVEIAHISMFEGHQISMHCHLLDERTKLINTLIDSFVLFQCRGNIITIVPESNNLQRVKFRFD